ncbi:MAG: nucleotidyltransferase domain-containing protein [Candidatus Undinarchaeales archaeon]|nr:nucleotidyltransferase domain-containing protein [Candidatus Undinarchaeales archaeon]MDP7492434.1 nucleotidyltransferase domain-containing protein [Candidatus Undinarchaeales archaeon]
MTMLATPEENADLIEGAVDGIGELYGDAAKAVLVYGSRVNGYAKPASDVDCFVVLEEGYEDKAGFESFYINDVEIHAIALTRDGFERGITDERGLSLEHVGTTMFNYETPVGKEYVESLDLENKYEISSRALDDVAYLAKGLDEDVPIYVTRDDIVETTIVKKVLALPEMAERIERMEEAGTYREMFQQIKGSYQSAFDRLEGEGRLERVLGGEKPVYEYTGERGGAWYDAPSLHTLGRIASTRFFNLAQLAAKRKLTDNDVKCGMRWRLLFNVPRYAVCLAKDYLHNISYAVSHREKLAPDEDLGGYFYEGMSMEHLLRVPESLQQARRERNEIKELLRGDLE